MKTTENQAYRLGSMPWRMIRERYRATWPNEPAFAAILALLDEWAGLLNQLGEESLRTAVQEFRRCVERERQHHAARLRHEKKSREREILLQLGWDPEPLPSLPKELPSEDSYALGNTLMDKAQAADVQSRLPGPLADLFELGQLVGRGLIGQADETDTMAIWTIASQLGCEEWVSGRPAGSPTGQRESIHRLVLNRLPEIDQLFSTRPLPAKPKVAGEVKNVVIPPSVSQDIACQVASRVDPRLQQIREDIADYAVMGAVDREKPVAATEPLLTIPKAMKQAGLSRRRLMELIADGKVSTKQVGQRQMIIPESLRAYLSTPDCQRQGDPVQAPPPTVSSRKHSIPDYLDG